MAKPNKRYAFGANETGDGILYREWRPWFRLMGRFGPVHLPDVFPDRADAEAAAARALVDDLNTRTRDKRRGRYARMNGHAFSVFLAEAGITPSEFAILYGSHLDRVIAWLDGAEDIPHPVRVLTDLLRFPGALDVARESTRLAIEEAGKETADA